MSKFPIALLIAAVIGSYAALAQQAAPAAKPSSEKPAVETAEAKPDQGRAFSRRRVARAAVTPIAVATPAPKRQGFFQRVFGRRDRATPAPVLTPTPTPKPTPRKVRPAPTTPAPEQPATPAPEKSSKPKKGETSKPAPATPAPPEVTDTAPPATPAPEKKSGKRTAPPKKESASPPPMPADPEAAEKWKYDEAKNKAMEDPEIQGLKSKADAAAEDAEGRTALRAYNKALFNKMRRIDPSIKDRIDRMESGVMKRLGE